MFEKDNFMYAYGRNKDNTIKGKNSYYTEYYNTRVLEL